MKKNYIPTINISYLLKSDFNSKPAVNTLKKLEVLAIKTILSFLFINQFNIFY